MLHMTIWHITAARRTYVADDMILESTLERRRSNLEVLDGLLDVSSGLFESLVVEAHELTEHGLLVARWIALAK
jgi:hypothetical protein